MYYLRTKSAVDAIKFTIDNKAAEKVGTTVEAAAPIAAGGTTATKASPAQAGQQIAVDPLSPEELKQMLSQSQNSEDDDCLMCGS
jgi:ribonucleoside-diphosphate reductase alpha chain